MTAQTVDDLADVFGGWALTQVSPAPQPQAGDSASHTAPADVADVAACRRGPNGPESEHWRGLSQMSQMSQGCPLAGAATADGGETWLALSAWSEADMRAFKARQQRLLRLGYGADAAERLADHLTQAERHGDDRRACVDCVALEPGRCADSVRAGLLTAWIGRELATKLQRCPAFRRSPLIPSPTTR